MFFFFRILLVGVSNQYAKLINQSLRLRAWLHLKLVFFLIFFFMPLFPNKSVFLCIRYGKLKHERLGSFLPLFQFPIRNAFEDRFFKDKKARKSLQRDQTLRSVTWYSSTILCKNTIREQSPNSLDFLGAQSS